MTQKNIWEKQSKALRKPLDIISSSFEDCGITQDSLKYKADKDFTSLLDKLGITLLITREYENMAIALTTVNKKLYQTFIPLAHPSGIITDKEKNLVYIVATRNPNQLIEFRSCKVNGKNILFPTRTKYYPGSFYFHDLAIINGQLYANSVGKNGIIKVNWESPEVEELSWYPECVKSSNGKPNSSANHIQLNSIAAGKSLLSSYFSASGDKIQSLKPGHKDYPVNKTGVIFSGKTGKPIATGLTRPHSAKLYKNTLYVNNSGHGEFGIIDKGKFDPLIKLPGWTRGLCIHEDIAFIGVSRILPKFAQYAPGVDKKRQVCGIFAFSLKAKQVVGQLIWEAGNQIFGMDCIDKTKCTGFYYDSIKTDLNKETEAFYRYR